MTAAFADPRFLLPAAPRSATVRPGAEEWLPLLERAGVETTEGPPSDVVIRGKEPAGGGDEWAPAVILEGKARPDGYTVAQLPITVFRMPFIQKTSFDPAKDFTYIIHVTNQNVSVRRRVG